VKEIIKAILYHCLAGGLPAGVAALQINLIFANWIKYMPAGPGSADATTPAVSSAILALGLAYLLFAFARWAPLLGATNAKLAVRKARPASARTAGCCAGK